jgi:hypothetical protein
MRFSGLGGILLPVVRKRRLIIGFALLGLAITGTIYAANAFIPHSETPSRTEIFLGVVSVVLCPPGLLTVPLFDIESDTVPGAILWLIVGLLNSALYAAIGALNEIAVILVHFLLWRRVYSQNVRELKLSVLAVPELETDQFYQTWPMLLGSSLPSACNEGTLSVLNHLLMRHCVSRAVPLENRPHPRNLA